ILATAKAEAARGSNGGKVTRVCLEGALVVVESLAFATFALELASQVVVQPSPATGFGIRLELGAARVGDRALFSRRWPAASSGRDALALEIVLGAGV